jgi:hypothetical protein
MSNFDNSNRGSIWKNEDRKSETHPQFKGSAEVNGVEYWVSGWLRKADANPKAPDMSFSFQAKEQQSQVAPPAGPDIGDSFDDDIPF